MKRQHATLSAADNVVAVQHPLTIAFVGERGVGKSGLINAALLGKAVVGNECDPTSPLPSAFGVRGVTRHFLRVSSNDGASFSATWPDGMTAAVGTMEDVCGTLSAVSKLLVVGTCTLGVTGPFPGLPRHVTLIDCPGWGDAPLDEFYNVLATADAIVTVTARGALIGTDSAMHRPRTAAREVFANAMYALNGGLVEPGGAFFTVHELCTQDDPACLLLHLAGAYTTQYLKALQGAIDVLCRSLDLDPAHFADWAQRVNTMGAKPVIREVLFNRLDTLPRDEDERFFLLSAKFNGYRRDLRKAGEDLIFGFEETVTNLTFND